MIYMMTCVKHVNDMAVNEIQLSAIHTALLYADLPKYFQKTDANISGKHLNNDET